MSVSDSEFSSVDSFEPTFSSSFVHSLSKVCKGWSTAEKSVFNRFSTGFQPSSDCWHPTLKTYRFTRANSGIAFRLTDSAKLTTFYDRFLRCPFSLRHCCSTAPLCVTPINMFELHTLSTDRKDKAKLGGRRANPHVERGRPACKLAK